jgi:hypothetical protein
MGVTLFGVGMTAVVGSTGIYLLVKQEKHPDYWPVWVTIVAGSLLALAGIVVYTGWRPRFLRRLVDPLVSLSCSYEHATLIVRITNKGETLREAGLSVSVPKSCQALIRWREKGASRGIETEEEASLTPDGQPTLRWHEHNLYFFGGGHTTEIYLNTTNDPGTYPARVALYDDADAPRSAELTTEFTVPPRDVDQERRRRVLEQLRNEFGKNKSWLLKALAGIYWHANVSTLHVPNAHVVTFLDPVEDKNLMTVVKRAIGEAGRMCQVGLARQPDDLFMRDEDRCEAATVAMSEAILGIDRALATED